MFAIIHVDFAPAAGESGDTVAHSGPKSALTCSSIQTRGVSVTIILSDPTVRPSESIDAGALVSVHKILAHSAILARPGAAIVNLSFTLNSGIT